MYLRDNPEKGNVNLLDSSVPPNIGGRASGLCWTDMGGTQYGNLLLWQQYDYVCRIVFLPHSQAQQLGRDHWEHCWFVFVTLEYFGSKSYQDNNPYLIFTLRLKNIPRVVFMVNITNVSKTFQAMNIQRILSFPPSRISITGIYGVSPIYLVI